MKEEEEERQRETDPCGEAQNIQASQPRESLKTRERANPEKNKTKSKLHRHRPADTNSSYLKSIQFALNFTPRFRASVSQIPAPAEDEAVILRPGRRAA